MRRSSAYPTRASQAGSLSSKSSQSQLVAKVEEKKKEADALSALERLSAEYVRRLSAIDYDAMIMADAGKVQGDVLSQWPEMFRILSIAIPEQSQDSSGEITVPQACERLVRIPVEELQERERSESK